MSKIVFSGTNQTGGTLTLGSQTSGSWTVSPPNSVANGGQISATAESSGEAEAQLWYNSSNNAQDYGLSVTYDGGSSADVEPSNVTVTGQQADPQTHTVTVSFKIG